MSLSRFKRQLLFNQHKILEVLSKDEDDIDYHKMMQEVYLSGYELDYFEYGVADEANTLPEEDCNFVYKVINMYDDLMYYWQESEELQKKVEKHKVQFPGFDLNDYYEGRLYSYAKFLIEDLGRFHGTRELLENDNRYSLNSHGLGPGVRGYREMLEKFKVHNRSRMERDLTASFTVEEIEDILNY